MHIMPPFNLRAWIDQNRELLKPPVGNKLLFEDCEFIVMAVGGPNSRKDFHHDPGPEFFFQIEGDMVLRTIQSGRMTEVPIRAGEVFLLPSGDPAFAAAPRGERGHRRGAAARPDELDGFSWYCEKCGNCLYLERVAVQNIVTQLPGIFSRFFSSAERRTCKVCGSVMPAPSPGRSSPLLNAAFDLTLVRVRQSSMRATL